jgi:hypothetical protein
MATTAKNPRKLELGPANAYIYIQPRASLILGAYPDPDAGVFLESVRPGAGQDVNGNDLDYNGNSVTINLVASTGTNPAGTVAVTGTAIVVYISAYFTADMLISALTKDPRAAFLVTAARALLGEGTGFVAVTGTPQSLAGGSNTGVKTDLGYLGDGLLYQVTTNAGNLTAAQTGDTPLDKVIIGGMVKVVIPFKQIDRDALQRGCPSARVVRNSDGSKSRVDFAVAVGQSMRQTLSLKMELTKIKGGFESPLPVDTIIIPEISPAEGEVNFPFAPTTQREIMTNWYAWPDPDTGRWSFFGDEFP